MRDLVELLAAAKAGDATARGDLVTRLLPRVTGLVHAQIQRRLRPQQHALLRLMSTGDVVQDVLLDLLRHVAQWDVDREEALVALLATLAEHRLLDQIRRSQAAQRDVRRLAEAGPETAGALQAGDGPATVAAGSEQLAIYREVLASFAERERALLALRLEDGAEFADIATRLGWPSPDAARKAFHAVQAKLVLRLRQRGIDGGGGA